MAEPVFKPTQKMAANARLGLELRAEFKRGGTHVGVARAEQLVERRDVTVKDIKSMYSYFARHAVDKNVTTREWGDTTNPSAGYIAWLLWGGDEGRDWVARQRAKF
jgi:hypothetical protein